MNWKMDIKCSCILIKWNLANLLVGTFWCMSYCQTIVIVTCVQRWMKIQHNYITQKNRRNCIQQLTISCSEYSMCLQRESTEKVATGLQRFLYQWQRCRDKRWCVSLHSMNECLLFRLPLTWLHRALMSKKCVCFVWSYSSSTIMTLFRMKCFVGMEQVH